MAIKQEITKLVESLKRAEQAALDAKQNDDGGTSNMDSCVLNLKGWGPKMLAEINSIYGKSILSYKLSGIWKHHVFVRVTMHGQGNCRTKMAQAATKSLKEDGYNAVVYYQMD